MGDKLPPLYAGVVPVNPGDLLILATDGIAAGFETELHLAQSPGRIADAILNRHFKGTDDALVFVGRYLGIRHGP